MLSLATVFVPFEKSGAEWVPIYTIPRFAHPQECIEYFSEHPELQGRHIDFQERAEHEFIKEYAQGVGTPQWLRERRHN